MALLETDESTVRRLGGNGVMTAHIEAHDWSATPLGPISGWPTSLRTVVDLMLRSIQPVYIAWGEELISLYNDGYVPILGSKHPASLGLPYSRLFEEIWEDYQPIVEATMAGQSQYFVDVPVALTGRDNLPVSWFTFAWTPLCDEAGAIAGFYCVATETTQQRKDFDQATREGEERFLFLDALGKQTARSLDADAILAVTARMLGEHLGVAVCAYADMDCDEDGFTIRGDWSAPGATSIVGRYSLSAFGKLAVENLHAGKPLVLNDNSTELPPEEAATFLSIGLAATICMPLVKDGRLTALMAIHDKVPHNWSRQELTLLNEVTERSWAHIERVRAEAEVRTGERRFREELEAKVKARTAALEQSEKNIRTIFETSHLYQGLLGVDGTVLYANSMALSGIETSLDEVIGKPFWETPWFSASPGMPETVRQAVASAAAGNFESMPMTLNLPAGIRSFDFSMRPVKNETGDVMALVPEAVDTTARIKTEQALQQAQKMEAVGNLTGGVAHDFNNLLMAVSGSLELLRKKMPGDPALLRYIDNALEGAKRGTSLVQRMMAFARRQELKSERIDLRHLVSGMTELLERSLGPMVAIETSFPQHLPEVETDLNQLESALLNLAVNARDAMHGEGRITILGREELVMSRDSMLVPGRYVCLSVTDTGEGMDEAVLKRATEPFFTTKDVGKGTGLGLSMIHGLAEQSGGALMLKSRPGEGTTAEIWLPAFATSQAEYVADASTTLEQQSDTPCRLTILAVDDDALVLMNTVEMLEDLGHSVSFAHSAKEAMALFEKTRFDLIVTDHAMPQITGTQLAAEMRLRQPKLPIILATGYAELPAGVQSDLPRLSKPFSQAMLAKTVRTVMAL
ncbi:MAG: sensor/response regulator hybrid [Rhizobium sp.]|nr:sensor/response regulator hybrid [Rhizobium sp.]